MTESENRDNKPKVLGLKSGTNTVRQSFSHGRSKSVVVETKNKKLLISKKGPVIEENNKNVVDEIETNENEEILRRKKRIILQAFCALGYNNQTVFFFYQLSFYCI